MSDEDIVLVYMTAGSKDEAERIGNTLVRERLAACVNVLDGMTSLYWWEDAVQHAQETVLIAKTRSGVLERLKERVSALHSYECPCIVAWPITGGHAPFLDWIRAQTSKDLHSEP